jgi:hypothetical protein
VAFLVLLILASAFPLWSQSGYEPVFDTRIKNILEAKAGAQLDRRDKIQRAVQLEGAGLFRAFLLYCQTRTLRTEFDFAPIEEARTDKQIGSAVTSAGSTSLVSKGTVPSYLGFAVENGALTQSVNGTTVTFRGNLVGLWDLASSKGFVQAYDDDSRVTRFLRRLSYSFAIDSSRQGISSQPAPTGVPSPQQLLAALDSTRQSIANWSARMDLLNRRDSRDPANQKIISGMLDNQGNALLDRVDAIQRPLLRNPSYDDWKNTSIELLEQAPPGKVKLLFYQRMEELRLLAKRIVPDFDREVESALAAYENFNGTRKKIFEQMNKKQLVAFEYVNTKQLQQTDLSTFRLIHEGNVGATRLSLTSNFAITVFNGDPQLLSGAATTNRLRDIQFAGQADFPLGNTTKCMTSGMGLGNAVLSFAFLAQHLPHNAPVTFSGITLTAVEGNIFAGQAKLTIPVKGSGVKIPISFTAANRTELIVDKKKFGANIGLTFDFDSLAAIFKK